MGRLAHDLVYWLPYGLGGRCRHALPTQLNLLVSTSRLVRSPGSRTAPFSLSSASPPHGILTTLRFSSSLMASFSIMRSTPPVPPTHTSALTRTPVAFPRGRWVLQHTRLTPPRPRKSKAARVARRAWCSGQKRGAHDERAKRRCLRSGSGRETAEGWWAGGHRGHGGGWGSRLVVGGLFMAMVVEGGGDRERCREER
ncbi:unnamed protein product [Chondrus crispus]|uniref:Uncharacterized protein n=1 Tax=Chondrus crispus TaxID=2769 RepID=R7Q3G8_CHOCR|nr:unnamed protein product [Chondrus crispus]CDF33087.1 unnamed protein product [Chondrus crispus]|eukprot:XP_005712890.1 unnamed protein product [Chondrus crispus]